MAAAIGAVRFISWVETKMHWTTDAHTDPAQAVLGSLASAMFTFIVFVSSALLVAVQLASSQLTPRIIALVFKDPVTRMCLVVFSFTFTFTLSALFRVDSTVPPLTTAIATYGSLANVSVFLFLIGHVGRALRPSGTLWKVGSLGRGVIESVYPKLLSEAEQMSPTRTTVRSETPTSVVSNSRDGVVLAFDIKGLVSLASRADCVLEMVPQVGDFIAAGDPLFRVHGGGAAVQYEALRQSVAVGLERTLEQDPAFAFRILVDIANKGLSPAINDPTTAVLSLDQIHHLLRNVGSRSLADGYVHDASGRLRLIYHTPNWPDFVHLAVTEIRHFGGSSIQIARRLRAMLENLIQTLPAERTPLLRQELAVLHRSAARYFPEPEDRALADISDSQGVGGKHSDGQADQPVKEGTGP
jgi:uncharacterized membrane protein